MDENNKFYETGVELPIKAQGGIYMLALTGPKNKVQILSLLTYNIKFLRLSLKGNFFKSFPTTPCQSFGKFPKSQSLQRPKSYSP